MAGLGSNWVGSGELAARASEGHALDGGAPQDGRHQGIQPVRLN